MIYKIIEIRDYKNCQKFTISCDGFQYNEGFDTQLAAEKQLETILEERRLCLESKKFKPVTIKEVETE